MKNGYYISAYLSIDKIGNLYDIMSNRHDMALALWEKNDDDISLVRYWELERLSRIKHHSLPFYDKKMALNAISKLLNEESINIEDIVEIWGCPEIGDSTVYGNEGYYFHSLSHLFSSLLIDTDIFYNNKILGLALDLKSDNETDVRKSDDFGEYVGCLSDNGNIIYFNISSPAILWCICKNELKMQEGSLMALATATQCHLKKEIEFGGNIEFYYPDYTTGYKIFNEIFSELDINCVENIDSSFSLAENLISAGMKEINRITISIMEKQIERLISEYSINPQDTYLSISGGFGLNCPTNSHIYHKYGFKGFLGAPCMDDSGEALGIGLYNFYMRMGQFNFKLNHAYYGKSFTTDVHYFDELVKKGYVKNISTILDPEIFVSDLEKDVVVWYDSSAEIGPRALGHRSIFGDPRNPKTKNRLNYIKRRQFWRPVAPIILRENVTDWFEYDIDSPFMLHTGKIKQDKKRFVPAILHYDDTARLQTICNYGDTADLYDIINHFYRRTGVPMICNTSLNDKGEPIINSPSDAIRFAVEKNIHVVYINKMRLEINVDCLNPESLLSVVELNPVLPDSLRREYINEENPYGLDKNTLLWRNVFNYDIKTKEGASLLKRSVSMLYRNRPDMKRLFDFF